MNLISRALRTFRREGVPGVMRAVRERVTPHPIRRALAKLARQPTATIVQIGAYIGPEGNDPLYRFIQQKAGHGLTAVLVEPVRDYYERLALNYAGLQGVHCENVAIADSAGTREFYRLGVNPREHGFPDWLEQLGSLKADRMTDIWDRCEADQAIKGFWLRHRVVDLVQCCTIADLLSKHGITNLDLLQIDAEGYDYEILKTIDFASFRPRFINYERLLLGEQEAECRAMLKQAGYRLVDYGHDTFCHR